jgi:hypothetical protein
MKIFVDDAADERRNDTVVGQRPIGDGEAGIARGDKRAGDEQREGAAGRENGEAVQGRLRLGGHVKSQSRVAKVR